MTGRQTEPEHRPSIAAIAASLILAAWYAGPATAAPSVIPHCDDAADASLDITVHELSAEIVSHDAQQDPQDSPADPPQDVLAPAQYLVPHAEAAARDAFQDAAAPVADVVPPVSKDLATPQTSDTDERPSINTRFPGVTSDDLARYRRQMYRTDI